MDARRIATLRDSWRGLSRNRRQLGGLFYDTLFRIAPQARSMFTSERDVQADRLLTMLDYMVAQLGDYDELIRQIEDLGTSHNEYGVTREHYLLFGEAFLSSLRHLCEPDWNEELESVWSEAVELLSGAMLEAQAHAAARPHESLGGSGEHTLFDARTSAAIVCHPDETVLQASLRAQLQHAHACGGAAVCSTCRIVIVDGLENCSPRNPKEMLLARKLGFSDNVRLACQTRTSGDVTIRRAVLDPVDEHLVTHRAHDRPSDSAGEELCVTVLFVDVEDFTSFTESTQPYDLVHVLNRYYHVMGRVVADHQGRILDYFGDGLLCVFGLGGREQHAVDAVRAGLAMLDAVETFNEYLESCVQRRFRVRLGVNTGKVIVGTVGIPGMEKLAAMGDAVNFAARIESANKDLGTNFLVADSTRTLLADVDEIEIGARHRIQVKGKVGHHDVHEIVNASP